MECEMLPQAQGFGHLLTSWKVVEPLCGFLT